MWIWTLLIVFGLPVIGYALSSYLIYTRASQPLHVLWTESNEDMRQRFPDLYFSDLEHLGFRLAGYLVRSDNGKLFYLAIFIHPQNKDSAEVFASTRRNTLPVFESRFEDGFALETASAGDVPHEISGGLGFPAFNFPQVLSTAELYRIHRLLKSHFSNSRLPVIAEGSGEVGEFARRAEVLHDHTMSRPDYRLSSDGTHYAYTMRGAMRAAWVHLWLIALMRRWSALHSARQHVKSLEKSFHEP